MKSRSRARVAVRFTRAKLNELARKIDTTCYDASQLVIWFEPLAVFNRWVSLLRDIASKLSELHVRLTARRVTPRTAEGALAYARQRIIDILTGPVRGKEECA